MADLGFWRLAEADGDWLAVVDPQGGEHRAGDLLARSNQAAHALRGLGLTEGDTLAVLLPNSIELIELFLAALQIGVRITPVNFHLVGPEVAYILTDSDAKAFVAHERFADVATKAVDEAGFAAEASFAVGTVAGFRPYAELFDGQPTSAPTDRTTGAAMHYTSGTTGRPKDVKRALAGINNSGYLII